ncbi:hypothetical protein GCM10010261_62570 [Streptomyces pilosus]|nr:hypothetical protein GCM10010261_62570 [Streptomyces pilosus]
MGGQLGHELVEFGHDERVGGFEAGDVAVVGEAFQYAELLVVECAGDARGLVFELEEQGGCQALQAGERCSAGVVVIAAVVGGVGGVGGARFSLGPRFRLR